MKKAKKVEIEGFEIQCKCGKIFVSQFAKQVQSQYDSHQMRCGE